MVTGPAKDHVVVVDKVMLPDTVILRELPPENVQVAPVVVMLLHKSPTLPIVIVGDPESDVTNTSSTDVGTDAPPDPPLVVDQLVVFDELQVPEPPRQYLAAI
jgi:hypothetical protein